jgi:hypothetical protein
MIDGGPAARLREAAVALRSMTASPAATPDESRVTSPRRVVGGPPVTRWPLRPTVPEGRTELRDGAVAVRTGDTVRVHFDAPQTRTRRHDKFERIVRATLPAVYGPAVDSVLAGIPVGTLTRSGDLLSELPARGLRLPLPDSSSLAFWPETRSGRDGPLVVSYRARIVR